MNLSTVDHHYFYTNDNVKLHYVDKGEGIPLVMLHGWSQSTEQYKYQIELLSEKYRVIALDMRGHGQSEKVAYGYKIYRLAKDLHELLSYLDLNNTVVLGHASGAAVMCCYWELFGGERLAKLIFVDKIPVLTSNPMWSSAEVANYGSFVDPVSSMSFVNTLLSDSANKAKTILLHRQITKHILPEDERLLIETTCRFSNPEAAVLLYNEFHQDCRDVVPRINLPTLIIVGRGSPTPVSSQVWMNLSIPNSQLVIFEVEEGGKHFTFIENPQKFNRVVDDFIQLKPQV
ncbi:alpha/beta fold hydrolase [Shewanella surugensis]|uniref:Alpha/beta hydrolase n=1 Tax=Shewanella surugensis TaxID=212020 RepID=A0ABT0LEG7_9GAMM|nr:alpha/beta hydrolase [Shewanella surugensis]MCL1125880.1 alpha/beta hydrolase [Shewanella surugensis]